MTKPNAAKFPLHLCQVLEEECAELDGVAAPASPGWAFEDGDLRDLSGLVARLRDSSQPGQPDQPGDPAARELRGLFSEATQKALDGPGDGESSDEFLRAGMVRELNARLDEPGLRRRPGFARLALPHELEILAGEELAGDDLRRFNRLLLEAAFPAELAPVYRRRLAAAYRRIHALPHRRSALCLSGGGIRSATFGLGVLQGLARHGVLDKLDYLSTVSGGGYVGGMLTAWIHRHPRGLAGVADELAGATAASELQPEPQPVRHLRAYSNYLSPKLGLLSADAWTLGAIYLRNLYLHWLVMVPLLLALLLLPRLYLPLVNLVPFWTVGSLQILPRGLFVFGSAVMTAAIAFLGWHRPSGGNHARSQIAVLRGFVAPLVVAAFSLTTFWAWARSFGWSFPVGIFVALGASVNVVGWLCHAVPSVWRYGLRRSKLYELVAAVVTGSAGGGLTYLAANRLFPDPSDDMALYLCLALPTLLGIFLLGETLFAGLVSQWTDDDDREWWARCGAWVLIAAVGWIAVTAAVVYAPRLDEALAWAVASLGGLSGVATALLARSSRTPESPEQKQQAGLAGRLMERALAFAAPTFLVLLLVGMSWGIDAALGKVRWPPAQIAESLERSPVTLSSGHYLEALYESPLPIVFLGFLGLSAVGLATGSLMNVNKFSLHATYRNRLIRTYLGASRERRDPNPFTGFDPDDNVELASLLCPLFLRRASLRDTAGLCERLRRGDGPLAPEIGSRLSAATRNELQRLEPGRAPSERLLAALVEDLNRLICGAALPEWARAAESVWSEGTQALLRQRLRGDERLRLNRRLLAEAFPELDASSPPRPFHLVNMALNLVAGRNLAWQQRKAESFTASPLHCGSFHVGYRPADRYGQGGAKNRGISLGTVVAISGAAASPNMGYHSSPAVTFLLTFFNARLGWWLGNPGAAGLHTYEQSHPRFALRPLAAEALGLTDDVNPYVYLSDGGHFENLGLYEMVLRRCRVIVVCDAGQDPDYRFEDLGNAIRKIRIDLGVPIELGRLPIHGPAKAGAEGRYCAVGAIRYSCVDGPGTDGVLIYLKPAVYGDEPRDILHYRESSPQFPHEPTSDQWFSESQFESYRMLGSHAVDAICGGPEWRATKLADWVAAACAHLGQEMPSWMDEAVNGRLKQAG